jgi:hypothetical protein
MLSPCRPSREIGPESQKRMHSAAGIDSWREERRGGWAGPLQQAWLHPALAPSLWGPYSKESLFPCAPRPARESARMRYLLALAWSSAPKTRLKGLP